MAFAYVPPGGNRRPRSGAQNQRHPRPGHHNVYGTHSQNQNVKSFVFWATIVLLAMGAARLLAAPPKIGEDLWIFKFLNVKCPTEEALRELESRRKACEEHHLQDIINQPTVNEYESPKPEDFTTNHDTSTEFAGKDSDDPGDPADRNPPTAKDDVKFIEDDPNTPYLTHEDEREKALTGWASTALREKKNETYAGLVLCKATLAEWDHYMNGYQKGEPCPDDWPMTQTLIFNKDCFQLPPRNCFAPYPPDFEEPLPTKKALWVDPSLSNVAWNHYMCDSFDCLRGRSAGDCRECFDWRGEATRWNFIEQRNLVLQSVLALKQGFLRLGLDVAGGSGSFAALLAESNITVVTTGMNTGAPFLETMALRGLPALHLPMKARLPFFADTFDIIHSQHAVQMLSPLDFEYMLFDWDRVLRPGGLIWLDRFYHSVDNMKLYTDIVALLKYKTHSWKQWSKAGNVVKFTAVLEKPLNSKGKG